MSALDESHSSLAANDKVERNFPGTTLFTPVIEVRCEAEWCVARNQINDRGLLLGKDFPKNPKCTFIPDKNIKFSKKSILLAMLDTTGNASDGTCVLVLSIPEKIADTSLDLHTGKRFARILEVGEAAKMTAIEHLGAEPIESTSAREPTGGDHHRQVLWLKLLRLFYE